MGMERPGGLSYLGDRIVMTWRLSWGREIKAKRKIESDSQCLGQPGDRR